MNVFFLSLFPFLVFGVYCLILILFGPNDRED